MENKKERDKDKKFYFFCFMVKSGHCGEGAVRAAE